MPNHSFDAELKLLPDMLNFIRQCAVNQNPPTKTIEQIMVAFEEALVNIILHSSAETDKKTLNIRCEPSSPIPGLKVTFTDHGPPFDPTRQRSPQALLSIEQAPIGGFGIYLFVAIMDEVNYQRKEDQNFLTLTKFF